MEQVTQQTRIEEIEGWLNAYRQGLVAYDRAHVRRLQQERAALVRDDDAAWAANLRAAERAGY
ncbi:MAG: hypothetical protein ACM3SS_02750 [Rhodospirillaceae bacterium]